MQAISNLYACFVMKPYLILYVILAYILSIVLVYIKFSIKRMDLPEEREMAGSAKKKQRMNIRLAPEDKELAERACVASGQSMTDYVVNLIRRDAPEVLKRQATITLTNAQFDNFMVVCQDKTLVPSPRILEAARKLDQEGF